MVEILTVCTGNICRSPLAEQLLQLRLGSLGVRVTSAGTQGLRSAPMTPEAIALAGQLGVSPEVAAQHRSRFLLESHLASPDLILTMTRDHRRVVAELAPARVRSTFTVREFARRAAELSDDDIAEAVEAAGQDAGARVRAAAATIASRRGLSPPPEPPENDDVIDPYGRSWQTYELSAAQLVPALDQVERVVMAALARPGSSR